MNQQGSKRKLYLILDTQSRVIRFVINILHLLQEKFTHFGWQRGNCEQKMFLSSIREQKHSQIPADRHFAVRRSII